MKLFLVKASYCKRGEEENKSVVENYLLEAISYKDAELQAIDLLKKQLMGECDFEIRKVSYDEIVSLKSEIKEKLEEVYWYEVKVTFMRENDKGEIKYVSQKFLIEAEDLENSIVNAKEYLKDTIEDWYLNSTVETVIDEVFITYKKE